MVMPKKNPSIKKSKIMSIRISPKEEKRMKEHNLKVRDVFDSGLKSISEFDKPKKIRRIKEWTNEDRNQDYLDSHF